MGKSHKRGQQAKSDPAQPSADELALRRAQSKYAAQRAGAEKHGQRSKVTPEEKEFRARQAAFSRDRARTPGTPEFKNRERQREAARTEEAIWNSTRDPETFESEEW
ncbi:hypothetical protein [Nonomuraea sp. NPDC003804]|uniref:hypothetical protein n=1 Tax=Nonomuraea sp. NPDC003804 TaxID=3154547 RepID=UPI0033A4C45F